jgi:hypothetical protein
MSRSRRKPVEKDKPRNEKSGAKYHRTIRRVTNEKVRYLEDALEDEELPDPKEIINDYNYSDWKQDLRFRNDEMSKKQSRK